jgi:hypothetical protein
MQRWSRQWASTVASKALISLVGGEEVKEAEEGKEREER